MSDSVPSSGSRPGVWWPASGLALLVVAASLVTRADADLWGHVRFGLDILETWTLPADDPYSFTQDKPWTNHEWLAELFMGAAYAAGGPVGLVLLKGTFVSGTLFVMWTGLRRVRLSVQIVLLVILVAGTLQITNPLRPQLWTFLGLAMLCRALDDDRRRFRRWLPALFAVWANAHGGWVVGCGVLMAWAVGESWNDREARREWSWLAPLSVAATLATPYGWHLWTFLATTVRPGREIEEWMPLWQASPWNWLGWSLAAVVSIVALTSKGPSRLSRSLVLAMLAYGGLAVLRIGPLYLESALVLAAPALAARWPARGAPFAVPRSPSERMAGGVFVLAPGLLAAWLGHFATSCIPPLPNAVVDRQAVDALSRTEAPGRLVTYFNWGEYAIWHLGPRLRVSMDGRRETVYSDATLAEHAAIVRGTSAGLAALASWRAEYVWLPQASHTTRDWLVTQGYRIDIDAPHSFVAVRHDLPPLENSFSGDGLPSCFPR